MVRMTCMGLWLALSGLPAFGAITYVVAPDGSDEATGSEAAPFRTIGRAAEATGPGDVCLVRAGTYRETVRPPTSGEDGKPIVFRNWPGERPRLVGSDAVTGWQRVEGNVWRAAVGWGLGKNNQVFIDGEPGQEARWPNKANPDPLDWEAVDFDKGSCNEYLLCSQLPDRPDGYWKGATLWVMAGAKWTSWSTVVTEYVAAEQKLIYGMPPKQGSIATNMRPAERRGGFFYLVGLRGELDSPGEWILDEQEGTLYLCVAEGQDPNGMQVEARRRRQAFDLSKRKHVQVVGFDVVGAALALYGSEHCVVRDVRATWIAHTRGGSTGYSLKEDLGVVVTGSYNTIRDSEIAYSAGNGIKLNGHRNAVINCWVHHTDYTGCYDAPVKMWGDELLVSHNTIHDTGRDCLQPIGQAHIIQYNNIYNMGRLAHDLGGSYVCGSDGGGTEFRYNWCHDNLAQGTRMGIYLDNFTSNYFVYRNVVWNIRGRDIHLNKPSLHNIVVNNTMMGDVGNWGRWKTDWMYACAYANNAVSGTIESHPQAAFADNRSGIPAAELSPESFQSYTAGAGKGLLVPGLSGSSPGIGAYEPGVTWKAGHDFANPPDPEYRLADTPLRNLVRHGSFSWIRWRGKLGPWTPAGAGTARIIHGPGGIVESYTTRDTIIGAGVELTGESADGIEQAIEGLRPSQEYEVGAWVKLKDGARLTIGVRDAGGSEARAESTGGAEWQRLVARLTTGAAAGKGVVFVSKTGPGAAFVDDISLVGIVKGIEPRLPGFAPLPAQGPPKSVPPRRKRSQALVIPGCTVAPVVDGVVSPGEYSGTSFEVAEAPGRTPAPGPPCLGRAAHRGGVLFVAVTVPVSKRVPVDPAPSWTRTDGAEVCFAYPDANARHPIFVLHGFPDGTCESSTEAGASQRAADQLYRGVGYAASVSDRSWTAEWAIPLKAADLETPVGLELSFNIGVFRQEDKQWIQWAGTKAQTWRVDRAGWIRLGE